LRSRLLAIPIILVFVFTRPSFAEDVAWDLANGNPPTFEPAFLTQKNYNEAWEFFFNFGDGTFVSLQMSFFNIGMGDHRSLVIAKLTSPDGLELVLKNGRARHEWSYVPGKFDFRVAKHHFYRDGDDFKLLINHSRGEIEITATPDLEPWEIGYTVRKPGRKGTEDYQFISVFAPRMTAAGRYRVSPEGREDADGEPWIDLPEGRGMALRQVASMDLAKMFKTWVRIAPVTPDAAGDGPDIMPAIHLFIGRDDEIKHRIALFRDGKLMSGEIEFDTGFPLDMPDDPADCCDIVVPVSAEVPELGRTVKGTIRIVKHVQSFDLLDVLSARDRFLASFKKSPRHNRFLIEYDLVIDEGGEKKHVSGTGFADSVKFR
jgi:hypothetical protein